MADIGKSEVMVLSVIRHLEQELSGWTGITIVPDDLPLDPDPPVVAVGISDEQHHSFETGNTDTMGIYFFDIVVRGKTRRQCANIRDDIVDCLHTIPIINFRTAMPDDGGYDESAQTVCMANPGQVIKNREVDPILRDGRVTVQLRPSGPFDLS